MFDEDTHLHLKKLKSRTEPIVLSHRAACALALGVPVPSVSTYKCSYAESAHADFLGDGWKLLPRTTLPGTWHKGYVFKGSLNYSSKITHALTLVASNVPRRNTISSLTAWTLRGKKKTQARGTPVFWFHSWPHRYPLRCPLPRPKKTSKSVIISAGVPLFC